ncbi:hypothetical protein LTR85_008091 [Meristemomyces frigidus]|nr:hypothetical protein LTR85_008091 [Meristemomyces frigidus]
MRGGNHGLPPNGGMTTASHDGFAEAPQSSGHAPQRGKRKQPSEEEERSKAAHAARMHASELRVQAEWQDVHERERLKEVATQGYSSIADPTTGWNTPGAYAAGIKRAGGLKPYMNSHPSCSGEFRKELFDRAWHYQWQRMENERISRDQARQKEALRRRALYDLACRDPAYQDQIARAMQAGHLQPGGNMQQIMALLNAPGLSQPRADLQQNTAPFNVAPLPAFIPPRAPISHQTPSLPPGGQAQTLALRPQQQSGSTMAASSTPQSQPPQSQYGGVGMPVTARPRTTVQKEHASPMTPPFITARPAGLSATSKDPVLGSGFAESQASQQEQGVESLTVLDPAPQSQPAAPQPSPAVSDMDIPRLVAPGRTS